MTFSLLYLPSFQGPAQTSGWTHFPLNYQNRAESDRKNCVEESSIPRPSHRGICAPIYARAWGPRGVEMGHPVPSTSILPPSKQCYCPLCSHTIPMRRSSQGGMPGKTLLNRNTPFSHAEARASEPTWRPLWVTPLPAVLIKRYYFRDGLQCPASLSRRLHRLHFWADRAARICSNQERVHKGLWKAHSFAKDQP